MHVAAKERYWLYINGKYVADGPPLCDPRRQYYDSLDITSYLQAGRNAIALLCHNDAIPHQYKLGGPGGLLAQIELTGGNGKTTVADTGSDWRCILTDWFRYNVPRLRFTLGFQQHVDMRKEPIGWTKVGFDDSAWPKADVRGPAIHGQWERLITKNIPPMQKIVTPPKSIVGCGNLRRREGMTFAEFASVFSPDKPASGYAVTHIFSPQAIDALVTVECDDAFKCWVNGSLIYERHQHRLGGIHGLKPVLQGRTVLLRTNTSEVKLNKGWNKLLLKVEQQPSAPIFWVRVTDPSGEAIDGVRFAGDPQKPELGQWQLAGPFPADEHNQIKPTNQGQHSTRMPPGSQWNVPHLSPDLSDAAKLTWHNLADEPDFIDPAALARWDVHEDGQRKMTGLQNLVTVPARW